MAAVTRRYGTLHYAEVAKQWVIRCEPHVSLRLKRMFTGVRPGPNGSLLLSDTLDNARDLEWFVSRYPLECDESQLLKKRSKSHRERQTTLMKLLAGRQQAAAMPLAVPARDYQNVAAHIVQATGQLLLADDVGLGKTVSAIAAFVDPQLLPVLVVTLTHLPQQWKAFIGRFAPHLRCKVLQRGTPYDLRDRDGNFPDVVICNYHKLAGWAETLAPLLRAVVWDEAQELRRRSSWKYNAARQIAEVVPYRMGLTATPVYNYGGECFNVLDCIAPGALGDWSEFLAEWGDPIHEPRAFGSYLRDSGLMLRRTREEVGRELPALQAFPETVECDLFAIDEVHADCVSLATNLLHRAESYRGEHMQAASEFDMRLRQATGIGKAPHVAAFVEMLVQNDEKVVLYGWHRKVYDVWLDRLKAYNPVLYTGSESAKQKEDSKQKFIAGDSRVLIVSLRAGAGMDGLQDVCKTVVFGELDWSPGVHEQCVGRVYRDGQKHPVFAYYLVCDEGSDPVVSDVLGVKRGQIEGLLHPESDVVTRLQIDPDHVKKLAAEYLKKRGIVAPANYIPVPDVPVEVVV